MNVVESWLTVCYVIDQRESLALSYEIDQSEKLANDEVLSVGSQCCQANNAIDKMKLGGRI